MKDLSYYRTTTVSYPSQKDYTTYYVYDKGETIWQGSYEEYKNNKDVPFPKGFTFQKVVDKSAYNQKRVKYNEEYGRLLQEFKDDLFEEFGVSENPKRERCYALAWDYGHAHGLESVYEKFSDLVELIK